MKKIIFATLLLIAFSTLNAQESTDDKEEVTSVWYETPSQSVNTYDSDFLFKNELAISYGIGTAPEITKVFEKVLGAAMLAIYDGTEWNSGAFSVEYFRNFNRTVGFGAIVSYERIKEEGQWSFLGLKSDDQDEIETNDYISIMPAAKIRWFNKKSVCMYSKIALGFTLDQKTQKYENYTDYKTDENGDVINDDNGNPIPTSEPYTHKEKKLLNSFGYQFSPVGIEAGSPRIRAFAELGFGVQGIAKLGLRCGF